MRCSQRVDLNMPKKIFNKKLPQIKSNQLLAVYKILRKRFGYQNWWPGDSPLEILIGAILTQNTAWTNVEKAIVNLKSERVLTFPELDKISIKKLAELIRPAGFFNIKAKRIKSFLKFLKGERTDDMSFTKEISMEYLRDKLLNVNGIGEETADSMLVYAFRKKSFVIDAYTKRVFSRHGLIDAKESYAKWRELFMENLPSSLPLYNDYHAQIVRLAKEFCRKIPKCENCPLSEKLLSKHFKKTSFLPIKNYNGTKN